MKIAYWVAADRVTSALRRGSQNVLGCVRSFRQEFTGAASELALSLYLKVPWTGRLSRKSDVGLRTQVRSSDIPRKVSHLIIRPRDLELYGDVPFVLVLRAGSEFTIKGWLAAGEASGVGQVKESQGRPPAWFVPEFQLRPIEELENP